VGLVVHLKGEQVVGDVGEAFADGTPDGDETVQRPRKCRVISRAIEPIIVVRVDYSPKLARD